MRKTLLLVLLLLWPGAVWGNSIPYSMILSVDLVPMYPDPNVAYPYGGETFYGSFTVEDSVLLHDGINLPGIVSSFRIQIGSTVWDMNDWSSAFAGFRGPCLTPDNCVPEGSFLFAMSPGFNVQNEQIVGLQGGVFGSADVPFVDFLGDHFSSLSFFDPNSPSSLVAANGLLQVSQIPEPATGLLLMAGIVYLAFRRASRWARRCLS